MAKKAKKCTVSTYNDDLIDPTNFNGTLREAATYISKLISKYGTDYVIMRF